MHKLKDKTAMCRRSDDNPDTFDFIWMPKGTPVVVNEIKDTDTVFYITCVNAPNVKAAFFIETFDEILMEDDMNQILVIVAEGKNDTLERITPRFFDTEPIALSYISRINNLEDKYWTYAEIVQDGQTIEPGRGEF